MQERPEWVRRVNAMAVGAGGAAEVVPLDADDLIERACRTTGLDDFGAPTWEEPFRRLVDAINSEAQMHVVGRLLTRYDLLTQLRVRLQVLDAAKRDPSIAEERVVAPVFITGPARSGTSILHELLAEDPNLRAPLGWEMALPLTPADGSPDRRDEWAEASFDLWATVGPEFAAVHELKATLPEECLWLLAPEFHLGYWATCAEVPSWMAWRAGLDPLPSYAFHRTMLQLLQHGQDPKPWVLKSPVHLGALPVIFAVYPDAKVIHTHRDPVKVVTSSASTVATGRWLRSDAVDPKAIGATSGFGMRMLLEITQQQRTDGLVPADQIADLHYLDLLRDPAGAIRAAYDQLDLPFAPDMAERIRTYLDERPQDKHGVHRYSPEDFGFDADQIRADFAGYIEASGVELEAT